MAATYKRRIKYIAGQQETYPLKDKKQIQDILYYLLNQTDKAKTKIKKYQADRNYILFVVGFNTAFRAEDLLQLRVKDLNGYTHIKENKTRKIQNFPMNKDFKQEIDEYIKRQNLGKYEYMFLGQKKIENGKPYNRPITRQQFHRIAQATAKAVGINYTFGPHSLRKTYGYHYINDGGNVLTLMRMYNHDDPDTTLDYVCWNKNDAEKARANFYIGVKNNKSKSIK